MLQKLAELRLEALYLTGGGPRNKLLCQFTADATGLPSLQGRHNRGAWKQVGEEPLDYGHGLWAGSVRGHKALIASNRSSARDLCLFTVASAGGWKLDRQAIDGGIGAANVSVIQTEDADLIFSTNLATGEIVTPFKAICRSSPRRRKRLYYSSYKFIGHIPGGLALATVAGSTAFKAICGSSPATGAVCPRKSFWESGSASLGSACSPSAAGSSCSCGTGRCRSSSASSA